MTEPDPTPLPAGGQSQPDWTDRVPGLRRMTLRHRQLLLLVLALVVMAGLGLLMVLPPGTSAGGTGTPPASAPSAPSTDQPVGPGASTSPGEVSPPPVEPTGSPATARPPGPSETEPSETGPSEKGAPGPVGRPTTAGSADPADEAGARSLINKVIPAWSEADLNGSQLNTTVDGRIARDTTRAWVASWRDEDHVTNDFVQASADRFSEIWGGAIQMSATVSDARVVRADMLENFGGESFWQVEVERTVTAPGIKQTEQITWYFMLSHDSGGPLLHEFFLPSDMSTDPSRHDHDHG